MSENALELEPDPELLALQFRLQRMLEVVRREPELEPWQVAERFGVQESTAAKALRGESFLFGALGPDDPVHLGARFGKLVVLEILTSAESGHHRDGAWCQVVCDCGLTKRVRSRHLRIGAITTCASRGRGCGPRTRVRLAQGAEPTRAAHRSVNAVPAGTCATAGCGRPVHRRSRNDTCRICSLKAAVAEERALA